MISLSKIVKDLHTTRGKKSSGLDAILDRAESGSTTDVATVSRSKAAALRSLQMLLTKDPKLLYTALEKYLQGDWELSTVQPGISRGGVTARGWLEHRSQIRGFPSSVPPGFSVRATPGAGFWHQS